MKILLLASLATSCAHFQPAQPVECGNVGAVAVQVQYPDLISCPRARAEVMDAIQLSGVNPWGWTVLFVGINAGFAYSNNAMGFVPADGKTFRETQTIWVSALHPHMLRHELKHVQDIQLGRVSVLDF